MTRQIVSQNRKARFNYHILSSFEAGIILTGTEVKSLRRGQASIAEAYAGEMEGALHLFNANIPEFLEANQFNHEPKRPRKLLVKKREMTKLLAAIARKGQTIVPLAIYFNERGLAKVELGLAEGKKHADKRASEKEKDWNRDKSRILKAYKE
jgi:SsrA-binding protein